ncbi:hypothetical protein RRG08_041571 [Elysia crispata]|uniref:CUB domain-containing protein n=1 Tax=Elysia crispata TaxID=231223 RepID=A0AAE1DMA5_9GAST|nr:hypothetical protein RRG08_041571 [Elysia crispata]
MTQSIRSPGYPEIYEANDECTYIISTDLPSEEYVLQISTVKFELDDHQKDCNTDYLEIYEGDMASGTLVKKWCADSEYVYKSRSNTVTLHFKSDGEYNGKGFIIFYSVVEYASVKCMEKAGDPIMIGQNPLYESFQGSLQKSRCEWAIQSNDPERKLIFEIFKASKISCQDAVFNFYEGNSADNHVSYQYCSTLNPFSKIYLTSDKAMLTFEPTEGAQFDENDDLILRISTRSLTYLCSSTNHALLEVEKDPVVFPLPYVVDGSGNACPVTLVTRDPDNQYLRVDVMGTSKGEATCDSDLIDVMVSRRKKKVDKDCNEATSTPVYRQTSLDSLDIISKSDSLVYLRASTVPKICSGIVNKREAFEDVVVKEHVPSKDGYPNLAHCRYLITADKLGDIVSLNITWKKSQNETDLPSAPGDFIKIYDGEDDESAVLFSSLDKPESLEDKIVTVVSTQKDMLLVLDSDARITGNALHIAYFALTGGNYCPSRKQKIMLDRQAQYIMSPNYPDALPLRQTCLYHLVAENPEDKIVVEVVEVNMTSKCDSLLTLYDGDVTSSSAKTTLGQVCGNDKPKFKHDKDITLLATSGDTLNPGGWKIKVYTQAKSSVQTSPKDSSSRPSPALILLIPLAVIIASVSGVI